MTLEQLRMRVRNLLQEPDPHGRFTDEQLNDHINEAYAVVAERSEAAVSEAVTDVESGVHNVEIPPNALRIERVVFGHRVLRQSTQERLDEIYGGPGWDEKQGFPVYYVRFSPSYIQLVPAPAQSGALHMTYSYRPAPLMGDQQQVELPDTLADVIPRYALHLALKSDEKEAQAQAALQEFEMYLSDAIRRVRRRLTKPVGGRIRLG